MWAQAMEEDRKRQLEAVGRKDRALDVIQRDIDENRKLFKQLLGMG
jgi:hypothetical protein